MARYFPFALSPTRTHFIGMCSTAARYLVAGTDLFNFAAMRSMDVLASIRDLRRASSSGVHLLLLFSGTAIHLAPSPPAQRRHTAPSEQLGRRKDRWQLPRASCGFVSLAFRLQPELDEAADGFGALNFHILMRYPIIYRLHFVLSPLRFRVRG
jgi:hypothetical protein